MLCDYTYPTIFKMTLSLEEYVQLKEIASHKPEGATVVSIRQALMNIIEKGLGIEQLHGLSYSPPQIFKLILAPSDLDNLKDVVEKRLGECSVPNMRATLMSIVTEALNTPLLETPSEEPAQQIKTRKVK